MRDDIDGSRAGRASALRAIDGAEDEAFAALAPTFTDLTKTADFQKRVWSLRESREATYQGK